MMNTLEEVDFGRIDAEGDTNLKDYFVDTGVLRRLSRGEKNLVVGRKGSGKTALFKQADSVLTNNFIVRVDFSDYAWEQHKAIAELGLPKENAFTSSWTFTFLIAACKAWSKSMDSKISKPAKQVIKQLYGNEDAGVLELLVDRFRRIRKLELPNAGDLGGLGGFELEELPEGETLARTANIWNRKLLKLADDLYRIAPVSILVDRLDDGWDASEATRNMLAGALKAARELNLRFAIKNAPSFVITFLRSDIFAELKFNDKNKMSADIEYLEWAPTALQDVVNVRIASSLKIPVSTAWDAVFSQDQMRQRAFISSYLLKRTMQRPRDIIAFCGFCRDAAVKAKHTLVETPDVYEGEKAYSRHIYDELVDEMHKQVGEDELNTLFKFVRSMGYLRFKFNDWYDVVKSISQRYTKEDAEKGLKTLFDFGVIGVPKVGGKGGGTSFEFVYQDRYLAPKFDGDLVVHPALRKQLDLKDAKAGANNTGSDVESEDSDEE